MQTVEHEECPHLRGWTEEQCDLVIGAIKEAGVDTGRYEMFSHNLHGDGFQPCCYGIPPFEIRRDVHLAMHKAAVILGLEEATDCPSYDIE